MTPKFERVLTSLKKEVEAIKDQKELDEVITCLDRTIDEFRNKLIALANKADAGEKCNDSPSDRHVYNVDWEYDSSGKTITCQHCGKLPVQS